MPGIADAPMDEHGRKDPPGAPNEAATSLGFLDYPLTTLAWKTDNLQ